MGSSAIEFKAVDLIYESGNRRVAVIDSQIVHVGDQLGHLEVMDITPNGVIVRHAKIREE